MLDSLLVIGGVTFPKRPDTFDVSTDDILNEFDAEDGTTTIETIRAGRLNVSASYSNLTAAKLATLSAVLSVTCSATFFNPRTNSTVTKTMQVSGVQTSKAYHEHDISTWNLSFSLKEL